jgi:hypothetical protein
MQPSLHLFRLSDTGKTWMERARLVKSRGIVLLMLVVCISVSASDQQYIACFKGYILVLCYCKELIKMDGMACEGIVALSFVTLPAIVIE